MKSFLRHILPLNPPPKGETAPNSNFGRGLRGRTTFLIIALSIIAYYLFTYSYERTDFFELFGLYTVLFVCFGWLYSFQKYNFKLLLICVIFFRLILLVAIPHLSQDFYRFIWDGRMLLVGFNPYLNTPESFIHAHQFPIESAAELYQGMGELNGSNYTNYPSLNQLSFALANLFSFNSISGAVIAMRIQLILADIGIIWIGRKLLIALKKPVHLIFLYALNPFIIIELTGNLHYEGFMLFFLLLAIYLIHTKRIQLGAVFFAFSVLVKLIPLLFLPLFIKHFSLKKLSAFYLLIFGVLLIGFLPFFSFSFLTNYAESVGLWFQKFEFNASFYYLAREIGYALSGYNEIALIGKILPVIVFITVLLISLFRNNKTSSQLLTNMLFAITIYYLLSTTVHPWYIASLVLLMPFTQFRSYPIVWSYLVFLSYYTYTTNNFQENYWLLVIQYGVVILLFLQQIIRQVR